jgi:phenylacetate-coenzyme A ligase PaaK-like adenylate-forming protein
MPLSHILFPDVYLGYYKLNRHDFFPSSLSKQITDQEQVLRSLIFNLAYTEYAKDQKVDFNKNDNYEILKSLPTVTYEDLAPYINRVWNGEESILWPKKITYFGKSSGTTNAKSKYIPVSEESIEKNHLLGGRDMVGVYLELNPNSKIGFDSVMQITGSLQDVNEKAGTKAGDISWVLGENVPWWANLVYALPKEVLEIKGWDKRLPEVVKFLKDTNLKVFTGTITWVHILLTESIKRYGVVNALELWPDLEVFFHGAVSMKPYKKEFQKLIPKKDFYYIDVYNASEGFFAFQDSLVSDSGMLLLCGHGIFYEFLNCKTGVIVTIKDLEFGSKYEMIISTFSGLWRYKIGDVVEVVNLDPVRIKVVGRTQAVLNAYGEELMVGNVDEAIKNLNNEYGYEIVEYTGAPIYKSVENKNGGHEWVIECANIPSDPAEFKKVFDAELCKLNSDYEAKRKGDLVLSVPKIHFVSSGTFYKWMEHRGKTGGQNKIPRLCEDRVLIDHLIRFLKNN